MHHSESANRRSLPVTCYLDESATDGGTPTAVVGGLVLNNDHSTGLDAEWKAMLDKFSLHPGLHMKDFGKHGRLSAVAPVALFSIFSCAVDIIRRHSIYTMAVTLEHSEYKAVLPTKMESLISQYGMCFMACVAANHLIAETNQYQERISVILDDGNPYAEHVRLVHHTLSEGQSDRFLHLGSLTFDDDDNVTALQAADVIVWPVRRRCARMPFINGLEPIETILDQKWHNQAPVPKELLRGIFARLSKGG